MSLERFENWQRWHLHGIAEMVLSHFYARRVAVCGEYRRVIDEYGADDAIQPIDILDAEYVDDRLHKLESRLKNAVTWKYLGKADKCEINKLRRMPHDYLMMLVQQAHREI